MTHGRLEHLPYQGESAFDRLAYQRYLDDVKRGKSLLQLMAMEHALTPEIRQSWSARTFTAVLTTQGTFDAVVCNISYHFHTHGARFESVTAMTKEAKEYLALNRRAAVAKDGMLRLPHGVFEQDGRIITFY